MYDLQSFLLLLHSHHHSKKTANLHLWKIVVGRVPLEKHEKKFEKFEKVAKIRFLVVHHRCDKTCNHHSCFSFCKGVGVKKIKNLFGSTGKEARPEEKER